MKTQEYNKKKTLAVLFGGCSTEYQVSLQSAYFIINAIDTLKYDVVTIGITRKGTWYLYNGDAEKIKDDTWFEPEDNKLPLVMISPNPREHGMIVFGEKKTEAKWLDIVFPVLHGKNGEDGTVQGICQLAGIPCVGCDMLASAICMNKELAHRLVASIGIQVPKSITLKKQIPEKELLEKVKPLTFPVFVKPVKAGSSFGISKVYEEVDLEQAVVEAFSHDDEVIIEENIEGFEVGCAVLGNDSLIIGEVDEIELENGFFDYTEKYTLKTSSIHMPARITPQTADKVKKAASSIYKTLGCKGFARVDMFLTPDETIVFNEVNTIPGFTAHSRYPSMLKGIGFSFEQIVENLIQLAV